MPQAEPRQRAARARPRPLTRTAEPEVAYGVSGIPHQSARWWRNGRRGRQAGQKGSGLHGLSVWKGRRVVVDLSP